MGQRRPVRHVAGPDPRNETAILVEPVHAGVLATALQQHLVAVEPPGGIERGFKTAKKLLLALPVFEIVGQKRAIKAAELRFQPGFNFVVGVNGVGKTSVLDAIGVCLSPVVHQIDPGPGIQNLLAIR